MKRHALIVWLVLIAISFLPARAAYGLPVAAANATHEHLLHQKDYLTWYDDDLRVPLHKGTVEPRLSGGKDTRDCSKSFA